MDRQYKRNFFVVAVTSNPLDPVEGEIKRMMRTQYPEATQRIE